MADTTPVAGISLYQPEPTPAPEPQMSLYNERPAIFDAATASDQADKYHFGLGQDSPGKDQLVNDIVTDTETSRRGQLARLQDIRDINSRQQLLRDIARSHKPGDPISPQEIDAVNSLKPENYEAYRNDPKTFYEKGFASKIMDASRDAGYDELFKQTPLKGIQEASKQAENLVTRQQAFMKLAQEAEDRWSEQSVAAKGMSIATGLLPAYDAYRLNQALDTGKNNLFPGEVLHKAVQDYWLMPQSDAITSAKAKIDEIGAIDPRLALSFARGLVQYSTMDRLLDNSVFLADVATIGSVGAGLALRSATRGVQAGTALKDVVKATAQRRLDTPNLLDSIGAVRQAGEAKGLEIINRLEVGNPKSLTELKDIIPEAFNPESVVNGTAGGLSSERGRRIATMLNQNNETFTSLVQRPVSIDRLVPGSKSYDTAIQLTDELFNIQYHRASDAVLGIRTVNQADNIQGGLYRSYQIGNKKEVLLSPNLAENARLNNGIRSIVDYRPPNSLTPSQVTKGAIRTQAERTLVSANDDIVINIGRKDAVLFDSAQAADRAAKEDYKMAGYRIKQQGQGFYIEYHKAVSEVETDISKALQIDTKGVSPRGPLEWIWGLTGSGLNRVDKTIAKDMVVASYGSTGLHDLMKSIAKPIQDLKTFTRKGDWKDFMSFATRQRDMIHPVTGERGYFSKTLGEFETDWFAQHAYHPSERQAKAYFAYTDLVNKDWMLRNLNLLSNRVRLGLENHSFGYTGREPATGMAGIVEGNTGGRFRPMSPVPTVHGKVVKDIDHVFSSKDAAGILIHDRNLNNLNKSPWYFNTKFPGKGQSITKRQEFVKDLVENKGYKIVQITENGEQEMRSLAHYKDANGASLLPKGPIHFVVTKDLRSAPLDLKQIPYKPGGHVEYPNGWFIGQPKLKRYGEGRNERVTYYGDNHLHFHVSEAESRAMNGRIEEARKLLERNSPGFEAHVRQNLPWTPNEFRAKFLGDDAPFDLHTPFHVKPSSTNLADYHQLQKEYGKDVFRKASDSPWSIEGKHLSLRYAGERNQTLSSHLNSGTAEVPHWNYKPAELIDPITTQLRATSQLLRDTYLGDLKMKASSRFVAEFGDLMKHAGGKDALMNDPIRHLLDPPWRTDITGAENQIFTSAKNYRRSVINMLGIKQETDKQVLSLQQKLVDWMHAGGKEPGGVFKIVEPWLLHKEVDPLKYFKSIAYHAQVGLFVPHQLVVQAMTAANTAAFTNPLHWPKIMGKAMLMRSLLYADPEASKILAFAGNASEKFGWKFDHFIESYKGMQRTGFGKVGGEHVYKDDFFSPPLIQGKLGKTIDATQGFFTEGERWNRYAAWSGAYDWWRTANPVAKFDDAAISEVLHRANLYSGNMTTAGKAIWQKGWASVPSQYMAFQARITEQFWGREFTVAEKARAFATYSALYGVPVATGTIVGVWPIYKSVKEQLMKNGIDVDENQVMKVLNDGAISLTVEALSGEKQDVGTRLAPAGVEVFRDILTKSDKGLLEALGGPSGMFGLMQEKQNQSLVGNLAAGGWQLLGVTLSPITSQLSGKPLPGREIALSTLNDFANNFAGYNAARKFIMMYNLNEFINKNDEVIMKDPVASQKWLSLIAGLTPQNIQDSYMQASILKERKDAAQEASTQSKKWFRRAYDALASENKDDFWEYWDKGLLYQESGGLNPHEKLQIFKSLNQEMGGDRMIRTLQHFGRANEKTQSYMLKQIDKLQGRNPQ